MCPGPNLKTTYLSKVLCVIKLGTPSWKVGGCTHPHNGSLSASKWEILQPALEVKTVVDV